MDILRAAFLEWVDRKNPFFQGQRKCVSDERFYDYRNSRETDAKQPTHQASVPTTQLVLSQGDSSDVSGRTGGPEPNFLDLALQESSEDSDDEWEEVSCTTTVADRPLVAAPSGFTLPTLGKRSEFLTLEVVEDWQPTSLPPTSHTNDPHAPLSEDTGGNPTRDLVGEQEESLDADLQLELELARGLADINTPIPDPSRQPTHKPDAVGNAAKAPPPTQLPVRLEDAVEQPLPTRASVGGQGDVVDPSVSTHKPKVSFKEKAAELTRRSLAPSKLLPPRNSSINPPFSTGSGTPSVSNKPPHPGTQAISHSSKTTSKLFIPKGFSHHIQNLRKRQTEESKHQLHERYGGITAEHARRDLTSSMAIRASTRSPDASMGTQPTQRYRAQGNASGKRVTKAQAEAEDVVRICRSTKSYIVDVAAINRREPVKLPGPQNLTPTTASSSPIQTEKRIAAVLSQGGSKIRAPVHPPVPGLPSQFLPTSFGGLPQGLKFTKKRKLDPELGEVTSKQETRGPRLSSSGGQNSLLDMGVTKSKLEDSGREFCPSAPLKKPRLASWR